MTSEPSEPRAPMAVIRRPEALRWLLVAVMAGLIWTCLSLAWRLAGDSAAASALMLAFSAFFAWFSVALARAAAREVRFDGERLVDDRGVELCRLDQVAAVDRGLSAFRPTSGFVVTLSAPLPAAWSPALWWRWGRRVGVGGATPGRAGRAMADAMTAALALRAAGR